MLDKSSIFCSKSVINQSRYKKFNWLSIRCTPLFKYNNARFQFTNFYIFILFRVSFSWNLKQVLSVKEAAVKRIVLWKILSFERERPEYIEFSLRLVSRGFRRWKIARKTFREESYLDEQVNRLTDAEWLAPPGLSASTTQTLYPRHSWSVSSSLLVICNSRLSFLLRFRDSSSFAFRLFSPLPKIPRTSRSSARNSFVSGASRAMYSEILFTSRGLL